MTNHEFETSMRKRAGNQRSTRRDILRKLGMAGAVGTASTLGVNQAVSPALADDCENDYVVDKDHSQDTAYYANGNLGTGITEYDPCINGNKWEILLKVNSNAATQKQDNAGDNDELNYSHIKFKAPDPVSKNRTFVHDQSSKYYVGTGIDINNDNNNFDWGWLDPAIDYAREEFLDKIPYKDEVLTVAEMFDKFWNQYISGSEDSTNYKIYDTEFNWPSYYNEINDVSYATKYEIQGPGYQDYNIQITDEMNPSYIDSINMSNSFTWNIQTPDSSPSAVKQMDATTLASKDIEAVPMDKVRANPQKYPVSHSTLQDMNEDYLYIYRGNDGCNVEVP